MTAENDKPRAQRKRFRYSLRTFLILVTLFALWLGWMVSRARTQRAAVETIMAAGGTIHFDFEEIKPRHWSSIGKPSGPKWLRNLLGAEYFDRPVYVSMSKRPRNDEWIEAINQLPTVRTIRLSGRQASDDTLSRLKASPALLELHLSGGAVTDDGIKQLAKFPQLRWLIMNHVATITDAGVNRLQPLRELQELNLLQTNVSDESLTTIAQLPNLQEVDVRRTRVTPQGVESFRQKRPHLKVQQ